MDYLLCCEAVWFSSGLSADGEWCFRPGRRLAWWSLYPAKYRNVPCAPQLEAARVVLPRHYQVQAQHMLKLSFRAPGQAAEVMAQNPLWAQMAEPVVMQGVDALSAASSRAPPFLVSLLKTAVQRNSLTRLLVEVGEAVNAKAPPATGGSKPVMPHRPPGRGLTTLAHPSQAGHLAASLVVVRAARAMSAAAAGASPQHSSALPRQHLARQWFVHRVDSNGVRVVVKAFPSQSEAESWAADMEGKGHKQTFWVSDGAPRAASDWAEGR